MELSAAVDLQQQKFFKLIRFAAAIMVKKSRSKNASANIIFPFPCRDNDDYINGYDDAA